MKTDTYEFPSQLGFHHATVPGAFAGFGPVQPQRKSVVGVRGSHEYEQKASLKSRGQGQETV